MKFHHLLMSLIGGVAIAGCNEKSHTIAITGQLEDVEDSAVISLYEFQGSVFNRVLTIRLSMANSHLP